MRWANAHLKIGAHNRAEVAVWAVRQGLPGPE